MLHIFYASFPRTLFLVPTSLREHSFSANINFIISAKWVSVDVDAGNDLFHSHQFSFLPSSVAPSIRDAKIFIREMGMQASRNKRISWNIYDILARMILYLHTLNINWKFPFYAFASLRQSFSIHFLPSPTWENFFLQKNNVMWKFGKMISWEIKSKFQTQTKWHGTAKRRVFFFHFEHIMNGIWENMIIIK